MNVGSWLRFTLKQALFACLLLAMIEPLAGCDSAGRKASARLRRQVHDLQSQVADLERRDAELRVQLEQVDQVHPDIDPEVLTSTPQVMAISLSSYSGMQGEGEPPSTIELFVSAVDGRNRPLQMVGTLKAMVLLIPRDGEPVQLGEVSLAPSELRDAWRNVFGTPSYRVEVPLEGSVPPGTKSMHVRVFHEDARTGRTFEAAGDVRATSVEPGVE